MTRDGQPPNQDRAHSEPASDRVLESLYPDGDGGGALDSDDTELRKFRQLRGMFAELKEFQEEPPASGIAILMAAAREAASSRRPAGWWSRVRASWQALAAHPAMSAAAAAVIVIGATGYLMSRGIGTTAQSTVARDDQRLDPSIAEPPAAAPALAAPVSPRVSMEEGAKESPAAKGPTGAAKDGNEPSSKSEVRRRGGVSGELAEPTAKPKRAERRPDPVADSSRSAYPMDQPLPMVDSASAQPPLAIDAEQASEVEQADAAAPPASLSKKRDRPAGPTSTAKAPPAITRSAERWFLLAKEAAAQGDCDAVKLLAQKVKSEDPGFFENRFRKDPLVLQCM